MFTHQPCGAKIRPTVGIQGTGGDLVDGNEVRELDWFEATVYSLVRPEEEGPDETVKVHLELEALGLGEAQLVAMLVSRALAGDRFIEWSGAPIIELGESPEYPRYPVATGSRHLSVGDTVLYEVSVPKQGEVLGEYLVGEVTHTDAGPRYFVRTPAGEGSVWFENVRRFRQIEDH